MSAHTEHAKGGHTPGEWRASAAGVVCVGSRRDNVICEAPAEYLASRENWRANAHLIAAAPELLEALKDLHETATPDADPAAMLRALSRSAHAIQKAEGRE